VRHVFSSLHGDRGIAGEVDGWETVTRSRPITGDLVTCVRSWAPEDGFFWLDTLNGSMGHKATTLLSTRPTGRGRTANAEQLAALGATFAGLLDSPGDVPLRQLRLHDILLWFIATGNWDGTVAQGPADRRVRGRRRLTRSSARRTTTGHACAGTP
jgi:hypothetical protein